MAAQFQGKLLITITEAHIVNYNTQILQSITNALNPTLLTGSGGGSTVFCILSMYEQVIHSKKVPKSANPHFDLMHTFNVFDPFDQLSIVVALEPENGDTKNFGRVNLLLREHSLVDQKSHELSLNIFGIDSKEIIGTINAHVQYKYRKTWEALYKGTTALQRQEYPAAVALFTHHLNNQSQTTPSLHAVYDFRCEAYCGMGKMQEALQDALKVLDLKPGYIPALIRLTRVYVLRAEFSEAQKILFRAQTLSPDDERVEQEKQICENEALIYRLSHKVNEAYANFNKGAFVNAANTFSDALDEVSNSSTILLYRAVSYLAVGSLDNCMHDINHMLQLQPGWPRTNNIMEGSVQKRGGVNVMMKRRWLILKHCFLLYYKTNNDVQPQGIICLHKATITIKGKKEFYIASEGSKRVYEMKADSEHERNEWSKALTEVSQTKLNLPEQEDAAQLVANSRKIIEVNVVGDIFSKLQDGFFLPSKVATTIGEKIIASFSAFVLEPQDKRGWLYKKGRLTSEGEWARRFFVLKPPYLYYLSPGQDEDLGDGSVFVPRGYISLDKSQVNIAPEKTAQNFAFEISPKSSAFLQQNYLKYLLSAESQSDFDSWVSAIRKITDPDAHTKSPTQSEDHHAPPTMLSALTSRAHANSLSHHPSRASVSLSSSNNNINTNNNNNSSSSSSSSSSNFSSIPVIEPPKYNLKPMNYISNYVAPVDALATTPAQKFSAFEPHKDDFEEKKIEENNNISNNKDVDVDVDEGDEKENNSRDRRERESSKVTNKYSLNNDPPAGVTGVESRFYKFGVPDPSTAPIRPPEEWNEHENIENAENSPLLGKVTPRERESPHDENTPGDDEKGCCCTVM